MSAEQTPDIETREVVRALLAELPTDATGHVTDCGYDDNEDCGCYSLPQRLRDALAPVLAAAVREAEQRALRELSKAETEAIDRWMDDHMYGHQISNSYAGMSCNSQCRTQALGMAVDRVLADRVAEPQHEAATSGKESEE